MTDKDVAHQALANLRDVEAGHIRHLASIVVDDLTRTPVVELFSPVWLGQQVRLTLDALGKSEAAKAWIIQAWNTHLEAAASEEGTLRERTAAEIIETVEALLSHPWHPSALMVERMMNHSAVQDLLKTILEETIRRFANRARKLDDGVLGGLGGKVARRSRTLGKGLLGRRAGGLAENLVSSVADEVEHALDTRITEFVETATKNAVSTVVQELSDPKDDRVFIEFRINLFRTFLDTPMRELSAELSQVEPERITSVIQNGLLSLTERPDFTQNLEQFLLDSFEKMEERALRSWLQELDLLDVWVDTTEAIIEKRLNNLVKTDQFESWWLQLFQ